LVWIIFKYSIRTAQ